MSGEDWQALVPFGGAGPTTLSSSSIIVAAWLPLLAVGPSSGLAATVGVGSVLCGWDTSASGQA